MPLDNTPRALNISPDGQELFFTEAGIDAVQVLDIASNQIVDKIPVGASPHLPSFTPDGNLGLVVAQGPGELDLVNPDAYTLVGTVKVGEMPHWTATTSDSGTAYVTNEVSNDVSVIDLASQTVTATIQAGNAPRKIVVAIGLDARRFGNRTLISQSRLLATGFFKSCRQESHTLMHSHHHIQRPDRATFRTGDTATAG